MKFEVFFVLFCLLHHSAIAQVVIKEQNKDGYVVLDKDPDRGNEVSNTFSSLFGEANFLFSEQHSALTTLNICQIRKNII